MLFVCVKSVGRRGGASNTQGYINGVARSHARALELRADPALRGEAEQRIASRASSSCKTAERLFVNLKATGAQVRAFRPAAVALMSEPERADVREKDLASRDERIRESLLGNLRVVLVQVLAVRIECRLRPHLEKVGASNEVVTRCR